MGPILARRRPRGNTRRDPGRSPPDQRRGGLPEAAGPGRAQDPGVTGFPRAELLVLRALHSHAGGPRVVGALALQHPQGFQPGSAGDAPRAQGPLLLPRPGRRVHRTPERGDMAWSRGRTRRAGAAARIWRPHLPRQDQERLQAWPVQRDLRLPGGERRAGRGEARRCLVNHVVEPEEGFDFLAQLEGLIRLAEQRAFGPSTQALIDEAASRDIPWIRLNDQSLVQLGQGRYQKRVRATMTSLTSALAVDIAGDKKLTTQLLAAAGLPVPRSEIVRTEDDAVAAARRIGFPVVTKPIDGNHGRGVGLDLRDEKAVRAGFRRALGEARRKAVVVESYVTGNDYRVLVIGGHMVAVAQRVSAHVIGDGEHTVRELVDITNLDPRRGIGHEKVLTKIKLDGEAEQLVKKQGYDPDDVPPKEAFVKLVATGNMSTGGISIDRTWEAHEENVEIAEEAARVIGLDVAGIDFLTPDISQPVRETGGAIVEVNAAPGFRMHTHPTEGEAQYVAKPVLDLLF